MRIRWRGLELPSQVVRDERASTDFYGRFVIEPFERGFGITIGNSLRRILLSSLEGAAVSRVKIKGAAHEFTSLPGVLEDVTDIVLNIKSLAINLTGDDPRTMRITRTSKGTITARDIQADANIQIINLDQHLATLTADVEFNIDMVVEKGRGWRPAEENLPPESEIGVFPVDSSFSPVTRVRYKTEETRVGQRTNYDRLILEVWTNGTVQPEDALVEAAKILRRHLNPFVLYNDIGEEQIMSALPSRTPVANPLDTELQKKLDMNIAELELSVRASNCLESARIRMVRDLVQCTESDLLMVRSFGKTSLREVKRKLNELGLTLGMNLQEPDDDDEPEIEPLSTTSASVLHSVLPPVPFAPPSGGAFFHPPETDTN
ncbi:MAG: DNA-directed RNA polymerase subunit alpha [Phycisphaerae bacterium]|nr:DNA-directed RNA polymerase subunit alpha [Phycisphaerae bacterium]